MSWITKVLDGKCLQWPLSSVANVLDVDALGGKWLRLGWHLVLVAIG